MIAASHLTLVAPAHASDDGHRASAIVEVEVLPGDWRSRLEGRGLALGGLLGPARGCRAGGPPICTSGTRSPYNMSFHSRSHLNI